MAPGSLWPLVAPTTIERNMTHAEQYSTVEPGACPARRRRTPIRVLATVVTASMIGATSAIVSFATPASADQISDAQAQASAITAKLNATEARIVALTAQINQSDYRLAQLREQIAASQAEITKNQETVTSDVNQLRKQAVNDYINSGTSNSATQLFTSNVNTSGIRSEYSGIATKNVTSAINNLHTAQAQLAKNQATLEQQKGQAQSARDSLQTSKNQSASLASQQTATLNSVDANIQNLVAQKKAREAAAAQAAEQAAFTQRVAAAQAAQASQAAAASAPRSGGGTKTSGTPVTSTAPPPPLSPGAAGAVQAAKRELGVPYVWAGASPSGFDCSGLTMWAYSQVGISLPHFSGGQFASTTHISMANIAPGDLLFYGPGGSEHVAMYIGGGSMIESPHTGSDVHISGVRSNGLVGVGRVV